MGMGGNGNVKSHSRTSLARPRPARLFTDLQQITTWKGRILITLWKERPDAAATQRRGQQALDAKSQHDSIEPPRALCTLPRLFVAVCHHCYQQVDQNQCREKDVHRKHQPETNDRVEQKHYLCFTQSVA